LNLVVLGAQQQADHLNPAKFGAVKLSY